MRKLLWTVAVAAVLATVATPAHATSFTFGFEQCVSKNSAANCATMSQYFVNVSDELVSGKIAFTFTNDGPVASSITDIYFDDAPPGADPNGDLNYLLGPATIGAGSGVSFAVPASPGNLPSAQTAWPVPFITTGQFSADSNSPNVSANGVNPGDFVTILFSPRNGATGASVSAAIQSADLRIGIHVQSIYGGSSETFVTNPVPEPGTLLLLGAGLTGLAVRRWRR